jgi:hypothetical protein
LETPFLGPCCIKDTICGSSPGFAGRLKQRVNLSQPLTAGERALKIVCAVATPDSRQAADIPYVIAVDGVAPRVLPPRLREPASEIPAVRRPRLDDDERLGERGFVGDGQMDEGFRA